MKQSAQVTSTNEACKDDISLSFCAGAMRVRFSLATVVSGEGDRLPLIGFKVQWDS